MRFLWASGTHVGRVRENNEDTIFPTSDGTTTDVLLVAVADGMGGAAGGEIASSTAMAAATSHEGTPVERTQFANKTVLAKAATTPALTGMGTTLTLAELHPDGSIQIAHVGDSRAYLLRDGELSQITSDHTLVAAWIEAGALTEAEAKVHPRRGMLMRSLGVGLEVEVDLEEFMGQPGDRLMLCSDGLNGYVDDPDIAQLLGGQSPSAAVWDLIEAANNNGGKDNISVVVVDVA